MRSNTEISFIKFCIELYCKKQLSAKDYVSIESVKKVIDIGIKDEEYAFKLQCSEYVKQKTLNAILWLNGDVEQESVVMNHDYF